MSVKSRKNNKVQLDDDNRLSPPRKKRSSGPIEWQFIDDAEVYVGKYLGGGDATDKIAAFDFDGTLSVPKSGAKFPRDGNDFKLWNKKLPELISSMTSHRLVIFSNQMGVKEKHAKLDHVQQRFEGVLRELGDKPCLIMFAIGNNLHRKPRTGMFDLLQAEFNDGIAIDMNGSFYVGDAAGRKPKSPKEPKDHSSADLAFAINVGLPFLTPEQFIAKQKPTPIDQLNMAVFNLPAFDPRKLRNVNKFGLEMSANKPVNDGDDFREQVKAVLASSNKVIVISVGLPASGKSFLYESYFKPLEFKRISRDELKTVEKCEKELNNLFVNAKQVRAFVDNTNYDLKSRDRWREIAKSHKASLIAVWLNVEKEHALHNNNFRVALNVMRKDDEKKLSPVPPMVIFKLAKEFSPPTPREGFDKVFRLNFVPTFNNAEEERVYHMFLTDK